MTYEGKFAPQQIQAFRYWIQGYQNFYEPMVGYYFERKGYRVTRPGIINRAELRQLADDVFDGRRKVGPEVPVKDVTNFLRTRHRLQADALIENADGCFLVECKSWGGFARFDEKFVRGTFVRDVRNAAFLLADHASGRTISGKILVLSSPADTETDRRLSTTFGTDIRTMYLNEILADPDTRPCVEAHLAYLDAAVAEVKRALLPPAEEPDR